MKKKAIFGMLSIIMALAVQVQAHTFLTNGLVAYYPLDGNANDISGNGNSGVAYYLTAGTNRFNQAGKALAFNGSSSFVQLTNLCAESFSVSLWVWTLQATIDGTTFYNGAGIVDNECIGSGNDYGINLLGSNVCFGLAVCCDSPVMKSQSAVNDGKWHHVVATRDNTSGVIRMYFDSRLEASAVKDTGLLNNQQFTYLGRTHASGPYSPAPYLKGLIDDLRIYNRPLSDSEVQQLYAYESGPRVNLMKAVKPTFSNLTLATNYQLQVSADGSTWYDQGLPFSATSTNMLYPSYYDVDDWNQLFFRLYFPPQPFLSNGLVAYYPFDGNGIDASGNGNNGVELNMTFPDGMYPFNKAAQFNGTNAAIIVTNSGNMNLLPLSLAVWVKEKGATGGEVGIITKYVNSSDNGFGLIAIGDLYKFWYFSETARLNSAGSPSGQLFGSAISDGMWHHVVASVNSVGCQLFTDGSLVTSCGWSGNATSPTTSQNILIGLYPDELNNYSCCRFFGGSMHNARIYNRALSASEVQQLYAYESGPRVNLIRAIIPSFDNLTLNANYRLQGSVDLKTWYDQAMPFSATTTEMIFPWYYAINDWNQLFFRLQANP